MVRKQMLRRGINDKRGNMTSSALEWTKKLCDKTKRMMKYLKKHNKKM